MPNEIAVVNPTVEVTVVDERVDLVVVEQPVIVTVANAGIQGPRGTQVLSGPNDPDPSLGLIGDQYLNTSSGRLFGPKTISGWGTGVVIGGSSVGVVAYVFNQNTPSATWTITHTLDFVPNIVVVDSAGSVFEGDYTYPTTGYSPIIATFSAAMSGKAYLS